MSTTTLIPAEQLVIITPRIEIWSGTVQIERTTDLQQVNGQLPPKGLVSDGRKQLISTLPLRPMHNVRKQIERTLKAEGFSGLVGSGIAVTQEKADKFLQELPQFEQAFLQALDGLINNLDAHYAAQENLYPAWCGMLASARLSAHEVRSRCRFGVAVFRLAPPDQNDPASTANQLYTQMTQSALPTLLQDIAGEAADLMERFKGRARLKQAQVDPVRRLVSKLKGFAFLDPRVQPVASGLTSVLDTLPMTGALSTTQVALCVTVLQQLINPATIVSHGIGVIASHAVIPEPEEMQVEIPLGFVEPESLAAIVNVSTAKPATRRRGFAVAL